MFHNGEGASGSHLGQNQNNNSVTTQDLLEGGTHIRDDFQNIIRDLQPIFDAARRANRSMSITNLLSRPAQMETGPSVVAADSFVINLDNHVHDHSTDTLHNHAALLLNDVNVTNPVSTNNSNSEDEHNGERNQPLAEAQQIFAVILKYVPFVLILFAKGLYDHHEGIFNIIVLFAAFAHADSAVKKEATKRRRRSLSKLYLALLYIVCCIIFILYLFQDEKLYLNLIFIRTYNKTLTVWDLLWFVTITDFLLKLITVAVKIFITTMPGSIIPFQKRVRDTYS